MTDGSTYRNRSPIRENPVVKVGKHSAVKTRVPSLNEAIKAVKSVGSSPTR